MNINTSLPVTGTSIASVTVTPQINAQGNEMCDIKGNGLMLHVVRNEKVTSFVGVVDNVILPNVIRSLDGSKERMLVDAVNNRTRERNYYQLYSRLLENEISEEEFDSEIDQNADDYVIPTDKIPSKQEFLDAIALADHIKGVESTGDIETLFSFRGEEFNDYCKQLLDGSL